MASKNAIKHYLENSYYHIYNRGVEKRQIFYDEQDYAVFLSYLKTYLLPKNEKQLRDIISNPKTNYKEKDMALKLLRLNNFSDQITLITYSLMPNHFHFLLRQTPNIAIDQFMNSLGVRYTMFFNKKYKRVGRLYQDVYKGVLVDSNEQLLYLSSYIHRNPLPEKLASQAQGLQGLLSQPSSLPEYLGQRKTEWVHPEEILSYFSKKNPQLDYLSFVKQTEDFSLIKKSLIDSDF
ncbi:transposase [Candidatus Gottesmanbacteria bacterium]|nr:transposase [Candidatus Gottesmanbacteria bacterium]MBI5465233.1 transposase [Candidatus Gottesmanbacteria bacterium]